VLLAQGDLPRALDASWASLDIRKRLAQADPSNTTAQHNVSVSHERVGDVLHNQGDLAGALAEYRASLTIAERLAAQDLANAQWQTDLARSCGRVAEALLALPEGDRAEARRLVARGLERMEALAQAHPPTPYEQQVRAWLEVLREQAG
jgi:tetratricopeptide (TPR) repeat protein